MRHKHSSSLAFNDMLFNILLGFVMLFIIAFLLINPPTKKSDVPAKAEVMIILEWEKNSFSDIDLWIQRDDTPAVGFSNKQWVPLHLDRDDLGTANDSVEIDGKIQVLKINREVITVRGVVAGEYFIGVHAYNLRLLGDKELETVKVTVIDVNPFKEIYTQEVNIYERGSRINLPGFTLDEEGQVVDVWTHNKLLGPDSNNDARLPYPDRALRENRPSTTPGGR